MKFFILLLSVAAIAFGMTLEECQQFQGGCESCTSAGCGFCNQFQGGSFCTNLTNAGAADCNNQNSAGDLMDIFTPKFNNVLEDALTLLSVTSVKVWPMANVDGVHLPRDALLLMLMLTALSSNLVNAQKTS